jgi:hypothetical protein
LFEGKLIEIMKIEKQQESMIMSTLNKAINDGLKALSEREFIAIIKEVDEELGGVKIKGAGASREQLSLSPTNLARVVQYARHFDASSGNWYRTIRIYFPMGFSERLERGLAAAVAKKDWVVFDELEGFADMLTRVSQTESFKSS